MLHFDKIRLQHQLHRSKLLSAYNDVECCNLSILLFSCTQHMAMDLELSNLHFKKQNMKLDKQTNKQNVIVLLIDINRTAEQEDGLIL